MDSGEIALIASRLFFGATASFLAIIFWSKTRDIAWMLMVVGTVATYAETVYSILERFGISDGSTFTIGSMPIASLVLPNLPTLFYIVAFAVMIARKTRRR